MKDLINDINISSVAQAERILKCAGSEELFEKAKLGDIRDYQGKSYICVQTKSGKLGWRLNKQGGGKASSSIPNNSPTSSSKTSGTAASKASKPTAKTDTSGGKLLPADDKYLAQLRYGDVKSMQFAVFTINGNIKRLTSEIDGVNPKTKKYAKLQADIQRQKDMLVTTEKAIELKGKGESFKTWRDFISYNNSQKFTDAEQKASLSELKDMLKEQKKKRDHSMLPASTKLAAKEAVWRIQELIDAHDKANEANAKLMDDNKTASNDY